MAPVGSVLRNVNSYFLQIFWVEIFFLVKYKLVHPITGKEGPEVGWWCSLSLTLALDGVDNHPQAPAALPPGKDSVLIFQVNG
jgi:hypothetical protein